MNDLLSYMVRTYGKKNFLIWKGPMAKRTKQLMNEVFKSHGQCQLSALARNVKSRKTLQLLFNSKVAWPGVHDISYNKSILIPGI